MWLDTEINRLGKLYSNISQPEIETLLSSEDLLVIKDLSSTELAALRNYLFVPKVILSIYLLFYLLFSIILNGKHYDSHVCWNQDSMLVHGSNQ